MGTKIFWKGMNVLLDERAVVRFGSSTGSTAEPWVESPSGPSLSIERARQVGRSPALPSPIRRELDGALAKRV
jgi:hypothetical protein